MKYSQLSLPFTNHQSEPLLTKKPVLTRSLLFNYGIENSTLTFELIDTGLEIQEETVLGTKVTYNTYNGDCLYTGYICEFPKTSGKNIITLKADIFYLLESPINKVIKKEEFPQASENLGKCSNIIIGNESAGLYEARQVEPGKYLAAWNELSAVTIVETPDGTDILPQITREIDPVKGYTYILYASEERTIYFNGLGPVNEGTLIENPAAMLNYLLTHFSELQIENLAEAQAIYDDRNYDGNFLYISEDIDYVDVFKSFSQSFNSRVIYTKEGLIRIKLIRWIGENPVCSIDESQAANFHKYKETKYLQSAWHRNYQIDPITKKYGKTPMDLETGKKYKLQTGEFPQKFLVEDMDSLDVGTRDAYMMGKPLYIYSFKIPGDYFQQLELGDTMEISHRDSYFPHQNRMIQVLRIGTVDNSGLYFVEGYDIHEIQGTPFIVREANHPLNPVIYEAGDHRNPKVWWSN